MTDRRLLAGALGLTVLLAACGGSSTPAASSGAGGSTSTTEPEATVDTGGGEASEAPEATEGGEATEAPAATQDAGSQGGSGSSNLTSLAQTLPEKVKGVAYERNGFDGEQLGLLGASAGVDQEQIGKILKDNGKSMSDVNLAIATAADSGSGSNAMVYAVQIEGVPADKWAGELGSGFDVAKPLTVAGKKVYGDLSSAFGVLVYPTGDTMYMLLLVDKPTAEDILGQLP